MRELAAYGGTSVQQTDHGSDMTKDRGGDGTSSVGHAIDENYVFLRCMILSKTWYAAVMTRMVKWLWMTPRMHNGLWSCNAALMRATRVYPGCLAWYPVRPRERTY